MTLISRQFVMSVLLSFVSSGSYLLASYELDKIMDANTSNMIGVIIDSILIFILQQNLFIGHLHDYKKFIIRFIIGISINIAISQLVFVGVHEYIKKYHKKFYDDGWDKNLIWIRMAIAVVTYIFISFPLRKYYIFKK